MKYIMKKMGETNINDIDNLCMEAQLEGHRFVQRTITEWVDGKNDFSRNGELLLGVYNNDECIAIGGLNIDPYINDNKVGRVRHLYVSGKYRHQKIAQSLLKLILENAKKYFQVVRLSTNNPNAASLYESIGFEKVNEDKATHVLKINHV